MEKRSVYTNKFLPYLLLTPQLVITLVFFYWPASQAVWMSFRIEDAFGIATEFVGFENYVTLFQQRSYYESMWTTLVFSLAVTILAMSFSLLLAVMADKQIKGGSIYRTLLIWPYAVAP